MVWVAPVLVLGLGTLVLVNYLKVKSKPEASPTVQSDKVPYDELIEKELREME
jgi:cytochrome c-type biogenesis protein CcmH/NrfF